MDASNASQLTDAQRVERIRTAVIRRGEELETRYPVLARRDLIGALVMIVSLAGMAGSAWLYAQGAIAWWLCLPAVAIFASFIHELEHDLIHWMYFRKRPFWHHLMLGLGWLARPSTINPWFRRRLHFNHHKHSGTAQDIEERAITNGQHWGLARLVSTGDWLLAVLLRLPHIPTGRGRARMLIGALVGYFPVAWIHLAIWYAFLGFHAASGAALLAGGEVAWSASTLAAMDWIDFLTVTWVGPNQLRSFCLHFVSSNMHYFGDVEDGNLLQQTQVLNPWWMAPFQLFCFNFGATHAIHHFVVGQPFYLRQLVAPAAHRAMRENGVRFNDLGTFRRANRLHAA